ncbi:MAG: hypothetical protein NT075_14785 [Chloroflexi bacterium]|nr:hypothetical protein [Chloroflexota bacterium]
METYQYRANPGLLCPVAAFDGADDPRVSPVELQAWQMLTQANFALHLFPGGHFYLNTQTQRLLSTIVSYLS